MAPREKKVVRPHWLWFVVLDGGILLMIQILLNRTTYEQAREKRSTLPSYAIVQGLMAGTVVVHAGEAMAAGRIAAKRGLRRRGWMLQTFVVGFPSLLELRKV